MSEKDTKNQDVEEEIEDQEEDEFDKAFKDATSGKEQGIPETNDDDDSETDEGDESGNDDVMDKIGEGDGNGGSDDDDDPNEGPDSDDEKAKQLEEALRKERQKTATWEGRISAANKRAKQAEEALEKLRQAKAEKNEKENLSKDLPEEDDKALKEFLAEFPELHRPIVALVKKELLPIIGQMIDDRLGAIEPQVTSIKEKIETDSTEAHFAAISKAHPDWKKIAESGALDKWIESQPTYIQNALDEIKTHGSTQQVIEMFDQYKAAIGDKSDGGDKNSSSKGKKRSKAKDLLAVPSSPSKVSTKGKEKNKDDFDSAWDDALKEK
jgi:hypothetical protein